MCLCVIMYPRVHVPMESKGSAEALGAGVLGTVFRSSEV